MTRRVMDRAPMEEALHQLMEEDYSECSRIEGRYHE